MGLVRTGTQDGVEVWEAEDRTAVEYRAADGAILRFETYRETSIGVKKMLGAKITTKKSKFQYARIDSHYYDRSAGQVYTVHTDSDSDANDTYLDEYDTAWGLGDAPDKVVSLCRAQWHGARFAHIVARGPDAIYAIGEPEFPAGFPEDWSAPVPARIEVTPRTLVFLSGATTGRVTRAFSLTNNTGRAQTVMVEAASNPAFHVVSGKRYPPDSGTPEDVEVTFTAPGQRRPVFATIRVVLPDRAVVVELEGRSVRDHRTER